MIRAAAREYGDSVALEHRDGDIVDEQITFAALERQSAALSKGLVARGAGKGSRIGFIFGNGPSFAIVLAAIARIGAVAIPISTLVKSTELVRILRQSDVSALIVQRHFLGVDYVERLLSALPGLAESDADLRLAETPYLRWIAVQGKGALPPCMRESSELGATSDSISDALLESIEAEVHATDQMVEIYTSGSMALPKGVKHTHGAVLFRAHYLAEKIKLERGQSYPAILPMFWVGGLMMSLMPNLVSGATTICADKTLSNSRFAMGSVLAADDMKAMATMDVIWALGMTETLGPYSYADTFRAPGYPLCAPLDHIADAFEVRVVDAENDPVADGVVGEIQVRGFALTPGLHKVAREDYFTPDGFYRTGDMGIVDGRRILFVGRDGDVIKTSSSNVSPAEVELELQSLDGVHSAYVVGVPDYERGQLIVAAVVARDGATLDFDAIDATMRTRLSSYKAPRAYFALTREEVPLLASNKVARRQLERMLAERLAERRSTS